jgi:RNA polymerase primary sigma factor
MRQLKITNQITNRNSDSLEKYLYEIGKINLLISYAVWWIRQAIQQAITEQSRLVRLPLNKVDTFNRYQRTCALLEQELGREATPEEVCTSMGISMDELREILKNNTRYLSTDAPIGGEDEEGTMLDLIRSSDDCEPDFELMDVSLREHIKEALSVISEREASIVSCYYGLNGETPFTLEEIGYKFDLTRERVRQIKERAIRRLRRASASRELRNYL